MDIDHELDLVVGPNGERNLTEQELFLKVKKEHNVSSRLKILIRSHNLKFKSVIDKPEECLPDQYAWHTYKPQDLVIKINPGETCTLKQSDRFYQLDNNEDTKGRTIYLFEHLTFVWDTFSPYLSDPHAVIGRDQESDDVWITDLDSSKGTFVNGDKLTPQTKRRMEDGDIVSLGISHLNPNCKIDQGQFWVLKYKEVPLEEYNKWKELCSQVFGNGVIFSNIIKYASLRDLNGFRAVSKFWKDMANPALKKKARITLDVIQKWVVEDSDNSGSDDDENEVKYNNPYSLHKGGIHWWKRKFNNKTAFFRSFGLTTVRLTQVRGFCGKYADISTEGVEAFENFFRSCGSKILKVNVDLPVKISNQQHDNRKKVIQLLFKYCNNIQEVELFETNLSDLEDLEVTSSPKELSLLGKEERLEEIFQKFPKVVKLFINFDQRIEFLTLGKESENFRNNLKNLKVLNFGSWKLDPEIAKLLNVFPIKIEELTLGFSDSTSKNVRLAISGFCSSLRKLTLQIDRPANPELCLPKMEKLEVLRIYICMQGSWKFDWVNEEKSFPNLKIINVETDYFEDVEKETLLETLLTEENRKQFPKIELAYYSRGEMRSKNFVSWKILF